MGNITFLGVEGSGKTVLTMALVNAFKAHEHEGWFLRPETRGAFRFLEQVPSELKEGTLPHQTTALRQLAWSVVKDGEHQQALDILDYPGEVYRLAFLNAEDENDPEEFRARVQAHQEEIKGLLGHLIQSEHIFVLFNLSDAKDLGSNAKNLDAVWVTNACLDYLHRLPHKPRVTLLLTQIDKYVDLEQYEFDPQVYVSHHLPLIARDFPNLDVCAVAALGAADSTYGIDSILLRSLFNAPAVQGVITQVQECRRKLKHALAIFAMSTQSCFQVIDAIMNLSCKAYLWQQSLPWFIKVEELIAPNGLVDAITCEECKKLLVKLYSIFNFLKHSNKTDVNNKVFTYLSTATLQTDGAKELCRDLQTVFQQKAEVEQKMAQTMKNRKSFLIVAIGIILLITIVVGVSTCASEDSNYKNYEIPEMQMAEENVYDSIASVSLNTYDDIFQKGLDYANVGNYEEALRCFRSAVLEGHPIAPYYYKIIDDDVFYVSKDGEEVVSVAGIEREEMAKSFGGTFQKEFYRDTYGNEYFYDTKCGQSKYDWLLEEKRKGNNLTKAGANERASNYIYSHKLYRTADGDQVFVREDEEEDFQKTATERGWNPQEVVTKRWNGLDVTGPADALMEWKHEFSDGGVLSDEMMVALGCTEKDIEKGKRYQVEHIKKAYKQLRESSNRARY